MGQNVSFIFGLASLLSAGSPDLASTQPVREFAIEMFDEARNPGHLDVSINGKPQQKYQQKYRCKRLLRTQGT